jgi:hypothetical protein
LIDSIARKEKTWRIPAGVLLALQLGVTRGRSGKSLKMKRLAPSVKQLTPQHSGPFGKAIDAAPRLWNGVETQAREIRLSRSASNKINPCHIRK